MRNVLTILFMVLVAEIDGRAQDSTLWSSRVAGDIDGGWVVTSPTGSADYLSVAYATSKVLNVEGGTISSSMPIKGVGVSVADFGTTRTYPTVGVFRPDPVLDPSGNTPDLGSPIATSSEAYVGGLPLFAYQDFDTPSHLHRTSLDPRSTLDLLPRTWLTDKTICAVVQLPPGDSGLLAVGADTNPASGHSGFTQDGYTTAAIPLTFLELGIAIGQDNSTTTSCKVKDRIPHGRLRCQNL